MNSRLTAFPIDDEANEEQSTEKEWGPRPHAVNQLKSCEDSNSHLLPFPSVTSWIENRQRLMTLLIVADQSQPSNIASPNHYSHFKQLATLRLADQTQCYWVARETRGSFKASTGN